MAERSTKPYFIRAIHEWCSDSNLTPYVTVQVDANTRVPAAHVKNGEILLNVSYDATHKLTIGNEAIQFSARFDGVSRECSLPIAAVTGIFARENGQGMFFAHEPVQKYGNDAPPEPSSPNGNGNGNGGKPKLQIIK
ncbi:MAG: ClpXP protease specificity-enhancing factor [Betaproteobacteria bacterium]|nr:ClpXP protease specificity-enhancing factor [Betaproteobacteria bacterium]MDH3435564.1 ClpXP protease specificity-enhancing factor [Betaproteobacteria bacterium]